MEKILHLKSRETDCKRYIPNSLTFFRIALTPLICLFITLNAYNAALSLFIIAVVTDFFDGYLAKKMNTSTSFGAVLDPLADKILIITVFFFLAAAGRITGIFIWPCALIIVREIIVLGLRGSVKYSQLPVIELARWKAAFQFISAAFLLMPNYQWISYTAYSSLWVAAFFSCWSGFLYTQKAINNL